MRGNDFLDKMELVDSSYVEEADISEAKREAKNEEKELEINSKNIKMSEQNMETEPDSPNPIEADVQKMEVDSSEIEGKTKVVKIKAGNSYVKSASLAACLFILIGFFVIMRQVKQPQPNQPKQFEQSQQTQTYQSSQLDQHDQQAESIELQAVKISKLQTAMGFEAYEYHDFSEHDNKNPWSEKMSLKTLPVYKNKAYDPSGVGFSIYLSEEQLKEGLELAAKALDLKILSTEIQYDDDYLAFKDPPDKEKIAFSIQAKTDYGDLDFDGDGTTVYHLPKDGIKLPIKEPFTYSNTTDEEAEKILSYLIKRYSKFLNFKNPVGISWGDYNFHNEFYRQYEVYDAFGSDLEKIINYNFYRAYFFPNERGELSGLSKCNFLIAAEKMGDYPIISVEEAKKRLLAGKYQTSVPAAVKEEKYIQKVELMYRKGPLEEVYLPYYRFYVWNPELDDDNEKAHRNGLKTYGAYYVPALEERHILNMPIYDGRFN